MEDATPPKTFFIEAYFADLHQRVIFLRDLATVGRENEALLLCCCYIEALGSRLSDTPERKAANFCQVLADHGGVELWSLVHPRQLRSVLAETKLLADMYERMNSALESLGQKLCTQAAVLELLLPLVSKKQGCWLTQNVFKGTLAFIAYQRIRSELVHDITAAPTLSFSETTYRHLQIPEINFELLYHSLSAIVGILHDRARQSGKWGWE